MTTESVNNFQGNNQQTLTAGADSNIVTLSDIFTSEFMNLHTQFQSIEDLLSAGGFEINSENDYDAIPDKEIDAYVAKSTAFRTWKEMLTKAANVYLLEH